MPRRLILALSCAVAMSALRLCAQDLAPRAYVINAVHSNAVTLTWSFYDGGVNLNGTIPDKNWIGIVSAE